MSQRIVWVSGAFGQAQGRRRQNQESWGDDARRRQFAALPREAARRQQLAAALAQIRALPDDDLAIEHAALIAQRAERRADLQIQGVVAERRNQPWRSAVEKRLARINTRLALVSREVDERRRARKAAARRGNGSGG